LFFQRLGEGKTSLNFKGLLLPGDKEKKKKKKSWQINVKQGSNVVFVFHMIHVNFNPQFYG
jgi:hypothetical protein